MTDALSLLALALMLAALIAAFGAISARSLFATIMYLTAAGSAVAVMILLIGAEDGALATALIAAAWAPVLLLAAVLLSARATKDARRGLPWVSILLAGIVLAAMWWPLNELSAQSVAEGQSRIDVAFWLAPLVLAVAAGAAAVLGYGERGALSSGDGG